MGMMEAIWDQHAKDKEDKLDSPTQA